MFEKLLVTEAAGYSCSFVWHCGSAGNKTIDMAVREAVGQYFTIQRLSSIPEPQNPVSSDKVEITWGEALSISLCLCISLLLNFIIFLPLLVPICSLIVTFRKFTIPLTEEDYDADTAVFGNLLDFSL